MHVDIGCVPQGVELVSQGRAHFWMAVTYADGHYSGKEVKIPKGIVSGR